MLHDVKIALIGDYSQHVQSHLRIPKIFEQLVSKLGVSIKPVWLPTKQLTVQVIQNLALYDGMWCTPGSPYENMDGVISSIRFARENQLPFLGTCGGFQHALIEYMRNVKGIQEADHQESNPQAADLVIQKLSCSLVGQQGKIIFTPGSKAAQNYGTEQSIEHYHCNYGFNSEYQTHLNEGDLRLAAMDENNNVRIVEHRNHPFFMATLFQPELHPQQPHPMIKAFINAALKKKG